MLKAYKYRIYPNNEQKVQIAKTFGCCRFVYNQTLAYRKEVYEKDKKSVSKTDCNNYCNRALKKDYEWLKEVDKFALTNNLCKQKNSKKAFGKIQALFVCRDIAVILVLLCIQEKNNEKDFNFCF